MNTHTLIDHSDIQKWVASQQGQPALAHVPDPSGHMHARLALRFQRQRSAPTGTGPSINDGVAPCSWTAWLAELDRQNLALRIRDDDGYEFVER